MENQEPKNEALIGGSGLNAGLGITLGRTLCKIGLHKKEYGSIIQGWNCGRPDCIEMQIFRRGHGGGYCD